MKRKRIQKKLFPLACGMSLVSRRVCILIAVWLFSLIIIPLETESDVFLKENLVNITQYINQDSIHIDEDSDFLDEKWLGEGTKENPFILTNLKIRVIDIRNVRSYFCISNCFVYDSGIFCYNVTNGIIISDNQLYECDHGLDIYRTSHCRIINNTIRASNGISCRHANYTLVEDNIIVDTFIPISLSHTSHSIIRNNIMFRNHYRGISITSSDTHSPIPSYNNSIYYNQIGCTDGEPGYDDGENIWDDNISVGNSWYDYLGYGVYHIYGSAGSIDRFPSICTIDCHPPTIEWVSYNWITVGETIPLESFTFEVTVNDSSGIDTVLIWFHIVRILGSIQSVQDVSYQMQHDPIPENPDRYIYTLEGPLYGKSHSFFFWANDTLGNTAQTEYYSVIYGPTKGFIDTNFLLIFTTLIQVIIAGFFVGLIILVKRGLWSADIKLLRNRMLVIGLPILAFITPYGLTIRLRPWGSEYTIFGASGTCSLSNYNPPNGWYISILSIPPTSYYYVFAHLYLTLSFLIFFSFHLLFIRSLTKYFLGTQSKNKVTLTAFIVYVVPTLFSYLMFPLYSDSTSWAIWLVIPLPILWVIGILMIKTFNTDTITNTTKSL